jgi:hypothetical protein
MIAVLHLLTVWAMVDLPTQSLRATLFHRSHGFEVRGGHAAGVFLAISRTILAKDIRQF